MTQRLERNSGTFLPIILSCLFFVFMAASALTSLPADTTPVAQAPVEAPAEAPAEALVIEEVEGDIAVPVAMLVEPTAVGHEVPSFTVLSDDLTDREIV